jgi:small subunit ribosomal protein S1
MRSMRPAAAAASSTQGARGPQAGESVGSESASTGDASDGSAPEPTNGAGAGAAPATGSADGETGAEGTAPSPAAAAREVADVAKGDEEKAAAAAPDGENTEAPAKEPAEQAAEAEGKEKDKKRAARAQRPWAASLYRSYRTRRPVEGKIEQVIKGGYEVRVGKARGFCPRSQISLDRVADPESLVGQLMMFRITQLRRGGEDVVLSRRALLEEERREEAKAVRATLIEGSVMQGKVAGLAPFGAFVDLGAGVMGLVHVSELAHGRVPRVEQVVKVGEPVNVKVLKIDGERGRISLSLRQACRDPWEAVTDRFVPGSCYDGKVLRLADFGAFVELDEGVEALAPAVEMPPRRGGWSAELEPGKELRWMVLSVDPAQRRLTVIPEPEGAPAELAELAEGATVTGKVQRVEKFGVFVWLGPGRVGLMPAALSGAPRGADLARRFAVAEEVEVDVLDVTEGGRRIRLAKKGVQAARTQEPRRESRPRRGREPKPDGPTQTATVDSPFGSLLADKLRAALDSGEQTS